jgi:uncharacterized membrane protein
MGVSGKWQDSGRGVCGCGIYVGGEAEMVAMGAGTAIPSQLSDIYS